LRARLAAAFVDFFAAFTTLRLDLAAAFRARVVFFAAVFFVDLLMDFFAAERFAVFLLDLLRDFFAAIIFSPL
jgi:hypothetical protein